MRKLLARVFSKGGDAEDYPLQDHGEIPSEGPQGTEHIVLVPWVLVNLCNSVSVHGHVVRWWHMLENQLIRSQRYLGVTEREQGAQARFRGPVTALGES